MKARFFSSVEGGAFWKMLLLEIEKTDVEVAHSYSLSETSYRNCRWKIGKLINFFRMYPWYCLKACFCVPAADVYVASTNPFCLPALLRFRIGTRSHSVFLVYDLFPDALELAQLISPQKLTSKIFGAITKYAVRNCSATVFLGDVLREHIETRYGKAKRAVVIPVGGDGKPFIESPPRRLSPTETVRIVYCGNLGRAHETETLLKYLGMNPSPHCELNFYSFGGGYEKFKHRLASIGGKPVCNLSGPLPGSQWERTMSSSHVALVTVRPGWEKVVMPSKTYSAMVAGQAILAICPKQSDLAQLVERHNCGWVVTPGDFDALYDVLERQMLDTSLLFEKRKNAYVAGHEFYDCSVVARQWTSLFEALQA